MQRCRYAHADVALVVWAVTRFMVINGGAYACRSAADLGLPGKHPPLRVLSPPAEMVHERSPTMIVPLSLSSLQAERFSDALIIAALQGPGSELWLRACKAYMARVPRPYMPVVTAISDGDFAGVPFLPSFDTSPRVACDAGMLPVRGSIGPQTVT